MNTTRYIMLGFIAFMAVVAISIFAYRIASPSRTKLEVGGVVPYLSIFGVLGFLVGLGLVVYDREGYLKFGLGLAAYQAGYLSIERLSRLMGIPF